MTAEPGLVVEDPASGFCGAIVRFDHGHVVLEDPHGRHRLFPLIGAVEHLIDFVTQDDAGHA